MGSCNDPKYLERQVWVNSVHPDKNAPDKNAPEGAVVQIVQIAIFNVSNIFGIWIFQTFMVNNCLIGIVNVFWRGTDMLYIPSTCSDRQVWAISVD